MKAYEKRDSIVEYHLRPENSKTRLSLLIDRPSSYYKHFLAPENEREHFKESPSLRTGNAVHVMTLEFETFYDVYLIAPFKTRTGKGFRDLIRENPDKIVLSETEYDQVRRMSDALLSNPCSRAYLDLRGEPEKSFYFQRNGIWLKTRPDYITSDSTFALDIKTTKDVGRRAFLRDSDSYKYPLSGAMMLNGVEAVRGIRPEAVVVLAVENSGHKKPDVAVYYFNNDAIEYGEYMLDEAIETLKQCQESNHWPAVSDKAEPLGIGSYHMKLLEKKREEFAARHLEGVDYAS